MKRLSLPLFLAFAKIYLVAAFAQQISPPTIEWQRSYGGPLDDGVMAVESDFTGGVLICGAIETAGLWVAHVNAAGNLLGSSRSVIGTPAFACQPLADGGAVAGGYSDARNYDYGVARFDSAGNVLWSKGYGGTGAEYFNTLAVTSDGGVLLGGQSFSGAGADKTSPSYGKGDYWVVRLDSAGNKLWDQSFGGTNLDDLRRIVVTRDGGYLLAGFSASKPSGNKTSPKISIGLYDMWIIRFDKDNNKLWEQAFGGTNDNALWAARETSDGGFICAGRSSSPPSGNKTSPHYGGGDFWAVRVDANGQKLWDASFGGSQMDECREVLQTPDGGFILAGTSSSGTDGNKTSPQYGSGDYWIVRLNSRGEKLWDMSFGGTSGELCYGLAATPDGGWVAGGLSQSGVSGNKTTTNSGGYDGWLVKLGPDDLTRPPRLRWESLPGGGSQRLLLNGSSNLLYRTEVSTNLLDWVPCQTNLVLLSEVEVMQADPGIFRHRFFRAVAISSSGDGF